MLRISMGPSRWPTVSMNPPGGPGRVDEISSRAKVEPGKLMMPASLGSGEGVSARKRSGANKQRVIRRLLATVLPTCKRRFIDLASRVSGYL
jgi:hypothetical protein